VILEIKDGGKIPLELERRCHVCRGDGVHNGNECWRCEGKREELTDAGRELITFVRKWLTRDIES
jgi:hypothetical protein